MAKAKKDDTETKTVVENPDTANQAGTTAGEPINNDTQGTQGETASVEETIENQPAPKEGNSEPQTGEESTDLDNQSEETGNAEKGDDTGSDEIDETKSTNEEKSDIDFSISITEAIKDTLEKITKLTAPDKPAKITEKRKKIAESVFKQHPMKTALYFTSNMIPFFEKNDALAHASGLKDKHVVTVNKE